MFRQSTTTGSVFNSHYLSERLFNHDPTPMSTDELIEALDRDGLWGREDHFLEVRTRGMYSAIRSDIRQEEADREVISDSGIMASLGAGILVAPLDPINWIPIGTAAKGAYTGGKILETTMKTAGAAGIATALQEPFLQGSQQLRTLDEAVFDLGGSMAIGAILGFGVTATPVVANKAVATMRKWAASDDWRERHLESMAKVWEQANDAVVNSPSGKRVKGGGRLPSTKQLEARDEAFDALQTAAERQEAFKELSMANSGPFEWARTAPGRLLSKVVGPQFRDPIDFVMKRAQSLEARQALEQIIEIPVALNKNYAGKPTAQAVTTEVDQFVGKWAEFRDSMMGGSLTETGKRVMGKGNSLYIEARRGGFTGGMDDFEKEIVLAVVRGYTHQNPAIEKASLMFKQVTDAVGKLAEKAGYEPMPATPKFALGYSPRKYVVANVRGPDGQGTAFIGRAQKAYYDDILDAEFTSQGKVPSSQQLAGINKRSKNLAKQAFRRITREETEEGGLIQANIRAGNPQTERVLPIPDEELIVNGWIDPRATDLLNVHVRQTVPALLLAEKFKTPTGLPDPNLRASLIPKITKEYDTLAATVKSAEERAALLEERDALIYTFKTLSDQIVHGTRIGSPNWSRRAMEKIEQGVQAVKLYQVTRLMGGLVMASVPDVANFQLRHGLARPLKAFVNDLRASNALNLATLKGMTPEAIVNEAKRMGAATEWATNADMASHLDLLSPYQARNGFQRFMASSAKTFSVSNFSVWWNDTMKTRSFRVGMDRILEGAEKGFDNLSQMDRDFMAVLGLGKKELERVGAAWRSQANGLHDNFLRVAYASGWDDQEAARLLGNALAKDNASTVVRPRIGDKATIWNNPLVQVITQFQNFVSSHALRTITYAEQRVIRELGFGPDSFRVYGGMVTLASLGMMTAYLYAISRDAAKISKGEPAPAVEKLLNNPGQWMALGIERSSLLGMYGYYNSYWERLGNPGLTRPIQNMMGDESRQVEARGRWLDRDPGGVLLGPTASQTFDAAKLAGHWSRYAFDDRDFKRSDARTVREAAPFQNHVIMRHFFDYLEKDGIGDTLMGIDDGR